MARFFLPSRQLQDELVDLPPEVVRHLRAKRIAPPARLELLDGEGLHCRAELLQLERQGAQARIVERQQRQQHPFALTLLFGLAKGEKFELVLQKGTELGVRRFLPVACHRSERQLRPERLAAQLQRWRRIIAEAAQQARRDFLPTLLEPLPLAAALEQVDAEQRLVAWEEESQPLAAAIASRPPASLALLVGPEGGLAADEVELARRSGFESVSLGERILRCETAGIAVPAILLYLYGDLGAEGP